MSTKIYNGFIFTTNNINDIHYAIMNFRRQLEPMVTEKACSALAEIVTGIIDKKTLKGEPVECPYIKAECQLSDRVRKIKSTDIRDPLVDFSCDISILPANGKILGMIYTEQQEFESLWMKVPIVREYGYWDNADQPEEVSDDEWEQRRVDWDIALEFHDIPAVNGVSAQCVLPYWAIHTAVDQVLKHIPSLDVRAKWFAMNKLFANFVIENKDSWCDFIDWVKETEEGRARLQQEIEVFKGKLIPEITKEILIGK